MNHVERFQALMNFQSVDRLPRIEWAGWWDQTITRWRKEGLPDSFSDAARIREDFFGLDPYRQYWLGTRKPSFPHAKAHGATVIEDLDSYRELREKHLYPEPAFDPEAFRGLRELQREGKAVVWFTIEGFFWFPRTLLGIEQHLFTFHDDPELLHEINSDLANYQLRVFDAFCKVVQPDFMTFAEDMSYNNGPMLSKEQFDEFLAPYYRKVIPALKAKGILPMVDSDGDVTRMIPWLEEVGLEGLLPWEKQSGVNVALIRERHPKFRMIGAFDKMTMKEGEAAMRGEFERLLPVLKRGGFIPSVDHQTPPEVSLANYRIYRQLLDEYSLKGAPKVAR